MKHITQALFAATALAFAAQAAAQVTIYEQEGFQGRSFSTPQRTGNLERSGLNNRASSVIVVGQRWQACEATRFEGRCTVLRPGQYPSLTAMGLNDRISSVRPLRDNVQVDASDYAPMPVVTQDFRRRRSERLYEADVTAARAVLGTPGQRCWIEREQVAQQQPQGDLNSSSAALGAIIGGILGHQPATVAQDVRRCDNNPVQATPAYWDVTYRFRGQEHRVQMASPPGRTVTVNRAGEPRV